LTPPSRRDDIRGPPGEIFAQRYRTSCPHVAAPAAALALTRTTLSFAGPAAGRFTLCDRFTSPPTFDPAALDTTHRAPFASGSPSAGMHGATIEFSDAPLCFAGRTATCSKRPPRERCG
jgi:hypothetical protein